MACSKCYVGRSLTGPADPLRRKETTISANNKLKLGKDEYSKEQVMDILSRMKKALSSEPEPAAGPDGRPSESSVSKTGGVCIAQWGTRYCINCGRFIKRHGQKCK